MRKYSIRLYQMHDRDLITFIGTHDFSLTKAVYCALSAFIKGEAFVIEIPPRMEKPVIMKKRVYCRQLVLDESRDLEMISFLQKISPGFRNNFFKNLLRLYLCTPISETFLENPEDIDNFEKMFEIFKQGKRHVNAAQVKKHTGKRPASSRKAVKKASETEIPKVQELKKQETLSSADRPKKKTARPLPSFEQFQEAMQAEREKEVHEQTVEESKSVVNQNSQETGSDNSDDQNGSDDMNADMLTDMLTSMIQEG